MTDRPHPLLRDHPFASAPVPTTPRSERPSFEVSFIVCTRDRAAVLEACIASIQAACRAHAAFAAELVVVDNGSRDGTSTRLAGIAETSDIPVTAVSEPRPGLASARNAGLVTAVDRSPAMLDAARREAGEHGVSNVQFRTPAELFSSGGQTFDFITCYFVMQRLPPDQGLPLLASLLDRLTPKGVAVFHIPFRSTASSALTALRWLRSAVPGMNALVNTARRRPAGEPFVRSYTYDLAAVFGAAELAQPVVSVVLPTRAGWIHVVVSVCRGVS